ncbi:unnamed protein product, partial [Allacma fusca]
KPSNFTMAFSAPSWIVLALVFTIVLAVAFQYAEAACYITPEDLRAELIHSPIEQTRVEATLILTLLWNLKS